MLPLLGASDTAAGASTGNTLPFMVGRVAYTFGFQASTRLAGALLRLYETELVWLLSCLLL